jgi:hypothetical protein
MSNFLQRVAATVAQPQTQLTPRLHPMIGSIFAPTNLRAADSFPIQQTETIAPSFTSNFASNFDSAPAPAFSARQEASSTIARPPIDADGGLFRSHHEQLLPPSLEHSSTPMDPMDPMEQTAADRPLLAARFAPETPKLHPFSHSDEFAGPSYSQSNAPGEHDAQGSNPVRPSQSATASQPATPSTYQPLVAQTQPATAQMQSLAAAANAARNARAEAARRAASVVQREADEIHIHIGRIEVAAIGANPQPVQRPTAPARRSLNLDEYLRRGNGRSG